MSKHPLPPQRLWWMGAGFVIWCSALVFLYALHAIGCNFVWSSMALRLCLAIVLLAHLLAIAWFWRDFAKNRTDATFGRTGTFLHTVVTWTLIAALAASVLTFGPALLLKTCI